MSQHPGRGCRPRSRPIATKAYTVTTEEPHSYKPSADFTDIYDALDGAWQLYKMLEATAVVIDNNPDGDGSTPATRIYRVGAFYIGED